MTRVGAGSAHTRQHRGGTIRASVLPSGLRVVTEHLPASQAVSVGFFVGVGSRHETSLRHGASHFLEHVLFKGTPTRSPEQISAEIECTGGDINAFTTKEYTCFHARVLAGDAPLALDVITDMMERSLLRPADVEAERDVILDEIAMHADDPAEVAHDLVVARLLGEGSLGRSVLGSVDSIAAMSRRQIVSHWRQHYRPQATVVAAAGDLDHDRIVAQLAGFGSAARLTEPSRARQPEPEPLTHPVVMVRAREHQQASAVLGLAGVGRFDPRAPALTLLLAAIGGGMSSRLFVDVRERRGLTYAIDAGATSWSDAGVVTVEWASSPDRAVEITERVRLCLAEVVTEGLGPDELERARGQVMGQTLLSHESTDAHMARLGSVTLAGDDRSVEEVLDSYRRVTVADVARVAEDLLTQHPVLAVVGAKVNRRALVRVLDRWHRR